MRRPSGSRSINGSRARPGVLPAVDHEAQRRFLWSSLSEAQSLRVLGMYLKASPELIGEMHEALDQQDWTALCELAHKFKSSSAMVGARPLYETCAELECARAEITPERARDLLLAVEGEYERVRRALEDQEPLARAN